MSRLRADWGLESDLDWVRDVRDDPTAMISALGIPMTRDEVDQLEEMFRDDPRSRLIAYGAMRHDEFAGAFIDQPRGMFVMMFTDALDQHRTNLEALPGDFPFELRQAPFSEASLLALMDEVMADLRTMAGVEMMSVSLDTINNVVSAELKSNDPTLKATLETKYAGKLVATVYPIPGPWRNADAGPGWQLLAYGDSLKVSPYTVQAATNEVEWRALWHSIDPVNQQPPVDLTSVIVVSFQEGIGSTCREMRLDAVVIDQRAKRISATTSDPLGPRACTADLAGAAFWVVAIDRASMPASSFKVALRPEQVCGGDCVLDTQIIVDLE